MTFTEQPFATRLVGLAATTKKLTGSTLARTIVRTHECIGAG